MNIWLNRVGTALGLAGLVFVLARLYEHSDDLRLSSISPMGYAALALLAIVYGASNILLAIGWRNLLSHLGAHTTINWTLNVYAVSQLAKYIPGNIFQFAGRQAMGVLAGIGNRLLIKSTVLELIFLVTCGFLHSFLLMNFIFKWTNNTDGLFIFFITATVALLILKKFGDKFLFFAGVSYLSFLFISGVIFYFVFRLVGGGIDFSNSTIIIGAYVISWLAGLLTPGAPAGLGVREAALLYILDGISSPQTILLAVVIGRFVTATGDIIFFAGGSTLNSQTIHNK